MVVKKKTKKKPKKERKAPQRFTKETQAKICKYLMAGCYRRIAANLSNVGRNTIREWEKKGEEGDAKFKDFAGAIKEAEAFPSFLACQTIMQAMQKDWRAAAWYLERRSPKEWGIRSGDEVSEEDVRPLIVNVVEKK
jgi:hypothetical protein